jgi:L-lactate dehydrogenase complex protein LldF
MTGFPTAARAALADAQLRRNLGKATSAIRAKRAVAVGELDDWEALRDAGAAIKARALATLPEQLERLEQAVRSRGGVVHWARDGAEACAIVARIAGGHGAREVIKVKSLATDEIGLNDALAERGIDAIETDLAELIVQLGDDEQSHILVPAIHRNRAEIAALFERTIARGQRLGLEPSAIAEAARAHLREKFLSVPVAVSGANFGVAETGSIVVVESEGNGRMCTTLPRVLITLMGIEKVLPEWRDLEVMLQLLPRSATAERMNPYTSIWTGVRSQDGPEEFHLVLLDGGRTDVLADEVGRQALRCIRCSACLNVCPVYSRVGGHAYESVYPGPIGAILTPQLQGLENAPTLPWASSLCGACYEVCPVKIDIPTVLVHLRGRVVREAKSRWSPERVAMDALARVFASRGRYERAQRLMRRGSGPLTRFPGPLSGWTEMRELPAPAKQPFRDWWANRDAAGSGRVDPADAAGRSHGGPPGAAASSAGATSSGGPGRELGPGGGGAP